MSNDILIRCNGGNRSWAHARLVASALRALGGDARRIVEGPPEFQDALICTVAGLDAEDFRRRLEVLARDPAMRPYLEGLEVEPFSVPEEEAIRTEPLQEIAVALFGSAGAPHHHLSIFAAAGFDVAPIGSAAIRAGALQGADVFVMPGGGWEFMAGQLSRLGTDGAVMVRDFVDGGGCYLSSCAGTHSVLQQPAEVATDWHPGYREMPKLSAESWLKGNRSTHYVRSPGIGVVRVRPHDADHPLVRGLPQEFDAVYYNGPILLPTDERYGSIIDCMGADHEAFTPGEGLFAGNSVRLDETALAEAGRKNYSVGGFQPSGAGWIVGFGLHPEFGCEPTMLEWATTARLIVNAAEWTTAQRHASNRKDGRRFDPSGWSASSESGSPSAAGETAAAHLKAIHERFEALAKLPPSDTESWLNPDTARSSFGLTPKEIWASSLTKGARLSNEMTSRLNEWRDSFEQLEKLSTDAACDVTRHVTDLRRNAAAFLSLHAVDIDEQDMGFKGLVAQLNDICDLLDTLSVNGQFDPFKAVAMSYLSAFGRLTAASLTLDASQALLTKARVIAAFG